MDKKGVISTVLSGIIFGIVPLFVSLVYALGFNAINVAFYRYLVAVPMLYIATKIKKYSIHIDKKDLVHLFVIATFGNSCTSILLNLSYTYVSIGTATTLHFMYPLFVCVLCYFVYKEKLKRSNIESLMIALIGVFMFVDTNASADILGIIIAIASGFSYAFYMVYLERSGLLYKYDLLVISFWLTLIASVILFIICLFTNNLTIIANFVVSLYLIGTALFGQIIAVLLLQVGIKRIGSTNASLFSLFEPLTSTVVGVIFLHDSLSIFKIIGSILIIISVYKLVFSQRKEKLNGN